jgi:hypothetical protein
MNPADVWLRQHVAMDVLREVVGRCAEASIAMLPVKGIVTSRTLYDDFAQRPITDIDVRIRPSDLRRFRRLASAARWPCLRVLRAYGNQVYSLPPLSLDVESAVGPPGICGLTVDTMLQRAAPCEIAPGLEVPVPEIHDHALLLVVNAFKDKMVVAAPWAIEDLARVIEAPTFDGTRFIDLVVTSRVATMVWIVSRWMETVRQNSAWGRMRRGIEARVRPRRSYAEIMMRQLTADGSSALSLRVMARLVADSRTMRARALLAAGAAWVEQLFDSQAIRSDG